jgi:Glycosyltransferase family 87
MRTDGLTIAIWLVIALCAAAMIAAGFSYNKVPVAASVAIAAALRVAFALMTSTRYTPRDVAVYFRATAAAVLRGHEPLQVLPGREWNFLELMPYVHAVELKSGLPWVIAVKIAPIAADLVLVWIVSRLAGADGRTRALQYAVNPLSLLVVSLHGQVEPVALALALGGVLLLKKDRPVLAGLLLGAAVAAKTWPILILIAVLPLRRPGRIAQILAGSAIVPVACLASGVIFLNTSIVHAFGRIVSYSGFVYNWTWSGTWLILGHKGAGYNSPLSGLASLLIVAGVAAALWLLRRHPRPGRAGRGSHLHGRLRHPVPVLGAATDDRVLRPVAELLRACGYDLGCPGLPDAVRGRADPGLPDRHVLAPGRLAGGDHCRAGQARARRAG